MRGDIGRLRRLFGDRRGAISVLAAFVMVGVIGVSALALEYGHGLLQKTENQRVADLAAYAGALVYGSTTSTTSAENAASSIAVLNGLTATPTLVSSPTGDGNNAVKVTVTSNVPLLLARVLTTKTTMPVSATAYAEVQSNAPGCVIALSGSGTGVSLSGGTAITADDCAVASNNAVTLTGGTKITAKNVDYGTSYSTSGGSSIVPPSGTSSVTYSKVTTSDPLSPSSGSPGSAEVTSATSRLATVDSQAAPSAPTVPAGTAVTFGYTKVTTLPTNCSDVYSSSAHTLTCTGTGPFNFGAISIGGGLSVTVTNTSSGATYNFSGVINANSTNGLIFNGGSGAIYNIAAGMVTGGGAPMSFSAGTFNIGTTSTGPCPSAGYSICNGSTLTIGGPSTFVLQGGIYNGGGATLSVGSGSTNSYNIGKAGDSNSINASTSKSTTLADATGAGDIFQTAGNITSGGGTCLWIPAAAEHDINGYISLAGGTTLGAGVYTVSDYVAFGSGGGGAVSCGGSEVGVIGSGVTFVIGGSATPSSGTCSGQAFCAAAGYSYVTLTAPASGSTTANLVVIGPTPPSTSTAGATFAEGATNVNLSGAFYFPQGPVTMSGAGTINSGGGCLELVGSQIALTGGSAATSTCSGLSGSSLGTTVTLVQ
jgi:Flp pilus assembly protein TadG